MARSDDSPVDAAVFSSNLGLFLKHKLPANTSIFTAEAWALYQSLMLVESSDERRAVIFSDSRSVLEALTSYSTKSCSNYLIPLIKSKYHYLAESGFTIQIVWIPSHVGIVGNEKADAAAKRAAIHGRKPKFKVPHTDYYFLARHDMENRFICHLEEEFREKGVVYFFHCYRYSPKPWFYRYSLIRGQIVTINRIRSNHYNLNYSLFRKTIVSSGSCPCGDPRQDVNHVIFRCALTRHKTRNLLTYLTQLDPSNISDIFPHIKTPSHKLCRLLHAFFQSNNICI